MSKRPPPFDYSGPPSLPIYPTRRPSQHDGEAALRAHDASGYATPLSHTRMFQPFEYWTPGRSRHD